MSSISASAPAKVILLGEHAVNRSQPALAAAIELRAKVVLSERVGSGCILRSGKLSEHVEHEELRVFAERIDFLRERQALDRLASVGADDFFAPLRYVLGLLNRSCPLPPVEASIHSEIPIGAGFGSGAAVACALALAAAELGGTSLAPEALADLAWAGDTIAHGGVASALDATTCAFGGVVRYTLEGGGRRVPIADSLRLVVADTGVSASTASVNAGVRRRLARTPALAQVFEEIGVLVDEAVAAIEQGDLDRLGHLLNLDQLLLERLGVSCPEIEMLVKAAREAGALGAKLSGSGGGGVVIALAEPRKAPDVAQAMELAGGSVWVEPVSSTGARIEPAQVAV